MHIHRRWTCLVVYGALEVAQSAFDKVPAAVYWTIFDNVRDFRCNLWVGTLFNDGMPQRVPYQQIESLQCREYLTWLYSRLRWEGTSRVYRRQDYWTWYYHRLDVWQSDCMELVAMRVKLWMIVEWKLGATNCCEHCRKLAYVSWKRNMRLRNLEKPNLTKYWWWHVGLYW